MTIAPKPPRAPADLSPAARKLWAKLHDDYVIDDAARLATLHEGLRAYDRAAEAAAIVTAQGITVLDRYGVPKVNPAVDVEHRSRTLFLAAMKQLQFKVDDAPPPKIGRPPRGR
ncbi:hypothetical protein SAMN05421829_102332 [Aromatoleum tolulyticum]|uniref:Phage terminase, small subunit, putative, P27 family n=1 Tax=Aromatoleum tolulyticum TaxID=34027 RepID=A0A1N6Q3Y7_9RHOO|nr:hypothetical protein [Aromatoleum tolulyticum]SIQ11250.1 hypothetical protein SAMN05421829_102332 [Aromatoleum tolulyticum]